VRFARVPSIATGAIALVLGVASLGVSAASAQEDETALLKQIKELMEARGMTRFVSPMPDSRSAVVAVDVSRDLYFYLERGAIRGTGIDDFYTAMDSGDMEHAYEAFLANSIMILRVTDYGWNGLGVPMKTEARGSGRDRQESREVPDALFKTVDGAFTRAQTITPEDVAGYEELLRTVLSMLQQSS